MRAKTQASFSTSPIEAAFTGRGTRCRVTRPDDPSPVAVHRLLWIVTPATTDLRRVVAGLRSTLVSSMRCMAAPCKLIGLRCVIAVTLTLLVATVVHAQRPTCILQVIEKKLVKDARTTFMKQCEINVQALCEKSAEQRKLAGPGRSIYIAKCISTFVGPP